MAKRMPDGCIQMSDGRCIYADSIIEAQDFQELILFFAAPAWPFVSGGGGSSGGGVGPQGPSGASVANIGARIFSSVDQEIPSDTMTTVLFDRERYDTDNMHDSVVNNSRITFRTAGRYLVGATFSYQPVATEALVSVNIRLNGGDLIASTQLPSEMSTSDKPSTVNVNTVYSFAVGDYVTFEAYQESGAPRRIDVIENSSIEAWAQRFP